MYTPLSLWRRAVRPLGRIPKPSSGPRRRVILTVERFEDRLTPSTYQWTGGGGDALWTNPGNWTGGPVGNFPGQAGDVAQFVDPQVTSASAVVNVPVTLSEIDFGSAANITIGAAGGSLSFAGGGKIVTADSFGAANTGTATFTVPIADAAGLTFANSAARGKVVVSGPISGSGPLTFSGTYAGGVLLSGNNSGFTGSVAVTGNKVLLGNAKAIPTGAALTVNGPGILDLNGNNLAVASLSSGGNAGGTVTNSSTTLVTLTLNGPAGGSFDYNGVINGPVGLVDATGSNVVTRLTTSASAGYVGGVTATSGTLALSPLSAGYGPFALNGGTLDLNPKPGITGLGGSARWTSIVSFPGSGPVFLAPDVLEITQGSGLNGSNQYWHKTPVQPFNGFTAKFTYQDLSASSTGGDGVAFVLQTSTAGTSATGGGGGGLGYIGGNVAPSVALELNIYSGHVLGGSWDVGAQNTSDIYTNPGAPWSTLWNGDPLNITVSYDGSLTLTAIATDTVTGTSSPLTATLAAPLISILGTVNPCIMGFTGSTGGATASQVLSNFAYQQTSPPLVTSAPFVNDLAASAGTTSNLLANVSSAVSAYVVIGGVTIAGGATVNVAADSASTANQPYSVTLSGNTALGAVVNLASNGTGAATLNLTGPVSGSTTTGGSMGTISGSVAFASSPALTLSSVAAAPGSTTTSR
jgi:Bacterial lectin